MRNEEIKRLTPTDLHTVLYASGVDTLPKRLKMAWKIVCDQASYSERQLLIAYHFMLFALDIEPHLDSNQTIQERMLDCLEAWDYNPDYIPNKTPYFLKLDKDNIPQQQTQTMNYSDHNKTNALLQINELLDVNVDSRYKDLAYGTLFFNNVERASQRVVISHYNAAGEYSKEARFYKDGIPFSTHGMIAHGLRGFAAFTLNTHGELSIFNHHGMQDGIAHSSMNAGAPVVAAGQLQIHGGRLIALTGYSGHYQPTLYNNLRAIDHFLHRGININNSKVFTDDNPSHRVRLRAKTRPNINSLVSSDELVGMRYHTPTTAFLGQYNERIKGKLENFNRDLQRTLKRRTVHRIIQVKERLNQRRVPHTHALYTPQKLQQYTEIQQQMQTIITDLENVDAGAPSTLLEVTIKARQQINRLLKQNNRLRQDHGKQINQGRLYQCIKKLNSTLTQIEKHSHIPELEKNRPSYIGLF